MSKPFEIPSEFTEDDLNTILEAVGVWELQCNADLEMIAKLKMLQDPEFPDEESKEAFYAWKNAMLSREKQIVQHKKVRTEKAILLKAKLILMNQRNMAENAFERAIAEGEEKNEK